MKKRSNVFIGILISIILIIGIFYHKPIYEYTLLVGKDFKESKLVYSENKCTDGYLFCSHMYMYHVSPKGIYFYYNTITYGIGWKYFSRNSDVGKDLIARLEGFSLEKQIENMESFDYDSLGLKYSPTGAFR